MVSEWASLWEKSERRNRTDPLTPQGVAQKVADCGESCLTLSFRSPAPETRGLPRAAEVVGKLWGG